MKRLRVLFINWALKSICNALVFDEVLEIASSKNPKGVKVITMRIGDHVLPEEEVNFLITEARTLKKFNLWKKLLAEMRSHATDRLVNKSKNVEDMVFSKAELYTLDVLEKKVEQIAAL